MFYSILWLRDELLQETSKDPELQTLKNVISTGWPVNRSSLSKFCIPIGISEMSW